MNKKFLLYPLLIEKLTALFKEDMSVKGILLFGSCARDINFAHNDIDFYLISGKETKRKIFYYEDIMVDVFYSLPSEIIKRFQTEEWLTTVRIFLEGKIIFDPEQMLGNLKEESSAVFQKRKSPSAKELSKFKYLVSDLITDIDNEINNEPQTLYLINILTNLLVKIHYRIIGEIPPKDNYIIKDICQHNGELYDKLSKIIFSQELQIKRNLIKDLVKKIWETIPIRESRKSIIEF